MEAVVLVDAAPGFEDAVEAELEADESVAAIARVKHHNYDLAVRLVLKDEAAVQRFLHGRMRVMTGVRAVERVASPSADLLQRLA